MLDREVRGESSLYLSVFSDSLGFCCTIKRMSGKLTSIAPDIFDDISAKANSVESDSPKFLGEFEILKRRGKIALNYDSFMQASEVCKCVLKNGRHIEDAPKLSRLLRRTLDAIDMGAPAIIARLKFMYLFARGEGYPVKEDFIASLSRDNAEMFMEAIRTPAADCTGLSENMGGLPEKFFMWIRSNTDIRD